MSDLDEVKKLTCRTYGHAWDPQVVIRTTNTRGKVIEFTSVMECMRCGSERRQRIAHNGELLRNNYTYVPGYLRSKEDPPLAKQDYRMSYMALMGPEMKTEIVDG